MNLFPIGSVAASSSTASINGIDYNLFEPNNGCRSYDQFNNLVTPFENQILLTRQKALPMLTIEYTYDNIFDREFRQLEHFLYTISSGKLNSFYVVDWSRGIKPSNIANASGDWLCSISDTRYFSTTTNYKSYYGLIWSGREFKIGNVVTLVANTSITLDIDAFNYGSLSLSNAQAMGILYPVYEVYANVDNLSDFQVGAFADDKFAGDKDAGYMRSGNITFSTKYKV